MRYAILSKTGSRDHNEDCAGARLDGNRGCFVLADGLGGHGRGEVASQLAVDTALAAFQAKGNTGNAYMDTVFISAQEAIAQRQAADRSCMDMKTTLVVLYIDHDWIHWGHIGDSRLYYFEHGKIKQRTLDHSVPQMLATVGEIKEKQIRRHPDRNRLLRVLGVDMDLEDLSYTLAEPIARMPGQGFLLCSDGFWELIEEKKMEAAYRKAGTPEEWLRLMEILVLKHGKGTNMDNYTAIAVWND